MCCITDLSLEPDFCYCLDNSASSGYFTLPRKMKHFGQCPYNVLNAAVTPALATMHISSRPKIPGSKSSRRVYEPRKHIIQ